MATSYAFVTLVTSDQYLPGALAVAAALKDVHRSTPVDSQVPFQIVCLVTPEIVDVKTIKHLRRAFDVVIGVEVIEEENTAGLKLLGEYFLYCVPPIREWRSIRRAPDYGVLPCMTNKHVILPLTLWRMTWPYPYLWGRRRGERCL